MARKLYARVRKDQEGTPMEKFILSRKSELESYNNAGPRKRRMANKDVKKSGGSKKLRNAWDAKQRKGTGASALHNFMKNHKGVGRPAARSRLKDQHTVSFSADPHNK